MVVRWRWDREGFTKGEQGDDGGARVLKRGKATALGTTDVGVFGLFLFTAIRSKVSGIAIIVMQYVLDW